MKIHSDFSFSIKKNTDFETIPKWVVRGVREDGSHWESKERHFTEGSAKLEIEWWRKNDMNAGLMKVFPELPIVALNKKGFWSEFL